MDQEKSKSYSALCVFLFGMFIVGSFILSGILKNFANKINVSYEALLDAANNGTTDVIMKKYVILSNGLANLIIYLLLAIALVFILRAALKSDYEKKVKPNIKKFLLMAVVTGIIFYLVCVLAGIKSDDSQNQITIEDGITSKYWWMFFITAVFLSPIVEELIYRKVIFHLLDHVHIAIPIIVSILAFSLPHMISTDAGSFGKWLLICLPYLVSGAGFAVIYIKSNRNIYTVMLVHFMNNLIAFMLVAF